MRTMGVRYIIPVLPFGFLLGGVGLAALFRSARRWQRAAGAALCLWLVAAAAGIWPTISGISTRQRV